MFVYVESAYYVGIVERCPFYYSARQQHRFEVATGVTTPVRPTSMIHIAGV